MYAALLTEIVAPRSKAPIELDQTPLRKELSSLLQLNNNIPTDITFESVHER